MSESGVDTAAIQVDDVAVPAAGNDDALEEGVVALRVEETRAPQQIEGVALGEEVTPQVPAGGITDLQLLDEGGVVHSTLLQILTCLRVVIELLLVESGSLPQQGIGVRQSA